MYLCANRITRILMSSRRATVRLESFGGVVYRMGESGVEVVLCGRHSPPIWALPKGTPDAGETREETAVREVVEETGLQVERQEYIGSIDYWFGQDRARCHKTVHYYLMRPTGGHESLHDHEFDEVRWFPAGRALEALTYENEVRVVKKGLALASR